MERNDEYETLKEEYEGTQVYDDFVSFMDFLNPDWRKEKELGDYAPEFCLYFINTYVDLVDENATELPFKSWLVSEYDDICGQYEKFKDSYQSARLMNLHSEINQEIESDISNDKLSIEEYDKKYDLLREKFDQRIYLDF